MKLKPVHSLRTLLGLATVAAALTASAQGTAPKPPAPPTPEQMRQMMESSMGAMVPAMGRMAEVMIETQLRAAERPETAERIALYKRNLFEALLKRGFTMDQAMQITVATGLPGAMPGGR